MSDNDVIVSPEQQLEQFVVFMLDHEEYALPVSSVAEVIPKPEVTPFPNAPKYIIGLVNLRGKVLPVLDLEKRFQLETSGDHYTHILIVENEQRVQFGILVDQVEEVIKIPHSRIQPSPKMLKSKVGTEYLPGVIVLENESKKTKEARIVLILDIVKILSTESSQQLREVEQTVKEPIIQEVL